MPPPRSCCASRCWAKRIVQQRPYSSVAHLYESAAQTWQALEKQDLLEAFAGHPELGDDKSLAKKFATTKQWAKNEHAGLNQASSDIISGLVKGNREYRARFGYIFIFCATGKSGREMLEALHKRIDNSAESELAIAAVQNHMITEIRMEKLLKELSCVSPVSVEAPILYDCCGSWATLTAVTPRVKDTSCAPSEG